MCPFVSADVRGGGRLRDQPKECLRRRLTWRLRFVTFVHVLFSPPILLILAFRPILFHTIVTEGHCMLFFIKEFFFKVEQSCLTVVCQMTCQRSQICWCASCWHHVFVLLVQSALIHFKILILPSARDWHCFPSRRLPYTSICSSIFVFLRWMFAFIPPFVNFVRYPEYSLSDILAHDSRLTQKVRWLFRVFYMPLWNRSGIISSVEGVWLDIPLTRSLLISHNFYVTARKIIYAACSIQAGRYFIGRN